jgi:hypothetical protein
MVLTASQEIEILLEAGLDRGTAIGDQAAAKQGNGLSLLSLRGQYLCLYLEAGAEGDRQLGFGVQGAFQQQLATQAHGFRGIGLGAVEAIGG